MAYDQQRDGIFMIHLDTTQWVMLLVCTTALFGCHRPVQTVDVTDETEYRRDFVVGHFYELNHNAALVDWQVIATEEMSNEITAEGDRYWLYPLEHEHVPQRAFIGTVPAGTTLMFEKVLFVRQSQVQKVNATVAVARIVNGPHAGKAVSINGISRPWIIKQGKTYRLDPDWLTPLDRTPNSATKGSGH